ncbi:MAG: thioredoxin-disulfide reductase [Planctomycetota bacterium]
MNNGSEPKKLVIIGSGPASWTAAIYAARASLKPVVYAGVDKSDPGPILVGGQLMLTTDVENYPGFPDGVTGPDMMIKFQEQAERFGTEVKRLDVTGVDFSKRPFTLELSDGTSVQSESVIIATGATANWLNIESEQRLARSGGGVSACAVCDGALPIFRDQPVGVVGGGDTAMEEATFLTKFASKVYVIHRRDELRASKIMQDRFLSHDNAEVVWNKVVTEVLDEGGKVRGVALKDTVTGEASELALKGLFIAIGHTPTTKFLKDSGIEMDDTGYIKLATRHSTTNIEGVFAAGDVADAEYRQAVTAAGMGCQAALDAERWLGSQGLA